MEANRSLIVLISVIVYMGICIGVGIWALRRTRSVKDFFMAGRDLGVFLTAFAVFSSTMSGFGFVGGPGLVYTMGMSSVWMAVASVIGFYLSFSLLGKRIRLFAELRECISLPDVAVARYRNTSVGISISIAIILGVLGYMAVQIKAMAIVMQDILVAGDFVPNISLGMCVLISGSILVFYTVSGGIVASVYTDLIQGAIMVVAALLVFLTVVNTFDGGMTQISQIIQADDAEAIGPWGTLGMIGCLSWFFIFTVGGAGQPHVITKMMMNKRISDAKFILPVSGMGYFFAALLWIGIGLVMRALVLDGQHPVLEMPDMAAPQFLQTYAHPLLAGVVFAGLFAAIMSTADGFLNIGTAAIVHDIPKNLAGKILPNELFWSRAVTVILAIVSALFALYSGDLVAILGAFGWGTFAAAIVPVIAIGLNWKRATPLAANAAVITSLVVNFTIKVFKIALPFNFDVGALALIISTFLFLSISFLSEEPHLDEDVEAVMDM